MSESSKNEKKAWRKPLLSVLTREQPEEAVLSTCKMSSGNTGPIPSYGFCYENTGSFCEMCSAFAVS